MARPEASEATGACLVRQRLTSREHSSVRQYAFLSSSSRYIMLMRDEKLAQLQTHFDIESGVLGIAEDGRVLLRARLTEAGGCKRIAEFFENFLGGTVNGPLRVVEAPRHAFADARPKPNATTDKYVSLINRASIRALEEAMGVSVDPIRFRANLYFDGAAAWSEHDWIDF